MTIFPEVGNFSSNTIYWPGQIDIDPDYGYFLDLVIFQTLNDSIIWGLPKQEQTWTASEDSSVWDLAIGVYTWNLSKKSV